MDVQGRGGVERGENSGRVKRGRIEVKIANIKEGRAKETKLEHPTKKGSMERLMIWNDGY